MKRLTPEQIAQLVEDWRVRMWQRDVVVRRYVESGLSPHSLDSYARHCEGISGVYDDMHERLSPEPASPAFACDDAARTFSPADRAAAYADAVVAMTTHDAATNDADSVGDLVPLLNYAELATFDQLSQGDLARHYVGAASVLYMEKAWRCEQPTGYLAPTETVIAEIREPTAPVVGQEPAKASAPELAPLAEAWDRYVAHNQKKRPAWKLGPPPVTALAWADFLGLIGNKPVGEMNRSDCERFLAFMEMRPRLSLRSYRGMSPELIETLEVAVEDRQSGKTAQEKVDSIATFFEWCEAAHRIARNPAKKLSVAKGDPIEVQGWTLTEIQQLLDPENLTAYRNAADLPARLELFPWLLVLAVHTGARLSELLWLRLEDFEKADEHSDGVVPVILIRGHAQRRLKTDAAERKTPLHPGLVALGLWDLIERRRAAGETMLFDSPTTDEKRQSRATKDFKRYTAQLGIWVSRSKVFHSFRHTFKTKLEGFLDKPAVDMVIGHKRQDGADDTYSHSFAMPMQRHHAALSQLSFGLDLVALRRHLNP